MTPPAVALRVFKYLGSEDERSPEFRYLQSVCFSRAREVFGATTPCMWRPGAAEPDDRAGASYVLLLGRENVWLTVETLRSMKQAIDGGAERVSPVRVADLPLDHLDPLYTPRDFEQIEQHVRDTGHTARTTTRSHLPVSLFSGPAFAALAARIPVSRLLTDPDATVTLSIVGQSAGIFHGFSDYYGETRADLLPYLPAAAQDVLEVGCGRGFTGRLIQERLGCRVTGVERHPEVAADAAQRLSRVIVGDILTVDVQGPYDVIVASELFEHLVDQDAFLLKMRSALRPGGCIVLSVPNVGHYSVVEDLLAGRWDYVPAGLLCHTHLRFFTGRTLADWMARLEFESTIVPQITELPERFQQLAAALPCDLDSLRTRGFYVILRPASPGPAGSAS